MPQTSHNSKTIGFMSFRLIGSLFALILSLYPHCLWPVNWLGCGLLMSIVITPKLSWLKHSILTFIFSLALFTYFGWKVSAYDIQICVLSITFATLSLFLILLALRWCTIHSKNSLLTIPCAWILIHTASEYLPLATITIDAFFDAPLVWMQAASLGGVKIYQALELGLLAAFIKWIGDKDAKQPKLYLKIYGLLFVFLTVYGLVRLHLNPTPIQGPRTALVQHNLSPDVLWRIHHNEEILQTYVDWAKEARKNNAELILFPQYDIGKDTFRSPQLIADLAKEIGTYLIFSSYIAVRPSADNDDFKNIAFLYSPNGRRFDFYESVEPFPFRRNPPISAHGYRPLKSPWGLIGMHVCYESSLARVVRKSVEAGALVHMDLANPGFFNDTVIPYYHLLQDKLRAIETGQYFYRITTNGNSGIIDPRGRTEQLTQLGEAKMLMTELKLMTSSTFYSKAPFLFPVLALLGLLLNFSFKKQSNSKLVFSANLPKRSE